MFSQAHFVLYSPTGTSLEIGKTFSSALGVANCTVVDLTHESAGDIEVDNLALFVVPVYAGRVAAVARERMAGLRGDNTPAVIIVVYGNRDYEDALVELQDIVTEAGFVPVAAAACIGEHSYSSAQYPIAVNRPDELDKRALQTFAMAVRQKLEQKDSSIVSVPGNRPYRDGVGFVPFHPIAGTECTLCGDCISFCPTQSISFREDHLHWEEGLCTMCCACLKVCRTGNLRFDEPVYHERAKMLHEMCETRREPEFFIEAA